MGSGVRPTGLDNATAALRYWEQRQEIVANNLANVSTSGFKGERAFARLMDAGGSPTLDSATDLRSGPITTTGAPLDLAIGKDGFFAVQGPAGERLSRGGALQINDQHQLVDQSGNVLLGENDPKGGTAGPVVIPPGTSNILIDSAGAVIADGKQVARLRVERPTQGTRLQHDANGLFLKPATVEDVPLADRAVRQGALEESNVSSVSSLVDMISVQRAYSNVQKAITTIDAARGIATTELGKPV